MTDQDWKEMCGFYKVLKTTVESEATESDRCLTVRMDPSSRIYSCPSYIDRMRKKMFTFTLIPEKLFVTKTQ